MVVGSPRAQINYTLNQPTDATRQAAQALLGEVLCLQSLSHPNIVRYLGVERDDISGVISIMLECAATHLPEYSTSRCGGRCTLTQRRWTQSSHDVPSRDGVAFTKGRYCAGGSIASLLDKFGSFNEALTRAYLRMVLSGLVRGRCASLPCRVAV